MLFLTFYMCVRVCFILFFLELWQLTCSRIFLYMLHLYSEQWILLLMMCSKQTEWMMLMSCLYCKDTGMGCPIFHKCYLKSMECSFVFVKMGNPSTRPSTYPSVNHSLDPFTHSATLTCMHGCLHVHNQCCFIVHRLW